MMHPHCLRRNILMKSTIQIRTLRSKREAASSPPQSTTGTILSQMGKLPFTTRTLSLPISTAIFNTRYQCETYALKCKISLIGSMKTSYRRISSNKRTKPKLNRLSTAYRAVRTLMRSRATKRLIPRLMNCKRYCRS
ncbi:hypothetical protein FOPG_18765 [Fusarium oxysporum f. sp. conglutinans race 2 54008]|uniref:Uncharacterized protein n=1 Tax=Fusarium oxysporum f. sp. conglutinans race 2 54008 TaxID=1089457 RepID=X0GMY7_FUSOX|nr:hypothetical protein FOPG_18765 [Fusarium oxysporum f. sp. conglutinans race 2 54008]